MILTSMPVHLLAAYDYKDLSNDKSKIINKIEPVEVAKPGTETAEDFVKNPDQPNIYTLRTDFKAEKGEGYKVNYQPYVASVGQDANDAEKAKVNKEIKLPDMAGYNKPVGEEILKIKYGNIVNLAKHRTGDEKNGYNFLGIQDKNYTAKTNSVVIKHVFQDMHDFNKFINRESDTITEEKTVENEVNGEKTYVKMGYVYKRQSDGNFPDKPDEKYDLSDPDQKAKFLQYEETTTDKGNTGSTLEVQALQENQRKGFVPQVEKLKTQVPEDTSDFRIEYRYNRAHYNVVFDTQDGTPLPTRSYYYDQEIPKIDEKSIPKKEGCEFKGWKPSHDLKSVDGTKTYTKGKIINKEDGNPALDLDVHLKMPALALGDGKNIPREKLTFTAVWKDKEKADYAVQFWVEKADHEDKASLLDKYEYMGTRVYKDEPTGKRPDLANEPVKDIVFPDLDQKRLAKIWKGDRFNRGKDLYLNKFFVYNKDLTDKENADPKNPIEVKKVSVTGKTVYNIYYDRQVYDLYFTKSNALPDENTFYPEIWGYDEAQGEIVKKGGPGDPYHYKARFNQLMLSWPNDAMQTKGFSEGMQSFGWGPNYNSNPDFPTHLDTPPYRLNADEFLDMEKYDTKGGYTKKIDKGDGTSIDLQWYDYKILSFGIKQDKNSMPHHMDFWMDGFKKDETIIRYDLYRYKADTNSDSYAPRYPKVQGFTGKRTNEKPEYLNEDGIDAKNDERAAVTPFPDKSYTDMYGERPVGEMKFIKAFFNNGDEWGDPDGWDGFDNNGYLKFEYTRNKYPLRFNYDPSVIKDDSEFGKTNSIDTFYEFPLACLSPDLVDSKLDRKDKEYFKENPKSLIDIPENLAKMRLTDLVEKDKKTGKLKIKRPDGVSDQSVFKGWALDPAGTKLVWKNKGEKMPSHPLNLYAKWGEPDDKWKVTIDPNGGKLPIISADKLTTEKKTIKEGEAENEKASTYPVAGYEGKNLPTGNADKDKANPQVFTVVQRQKLKNLPQPERYGYDFLGWEVIRYKKDNDGNYTNEVDNSYRENYKVPELYTFGEDVVSPITLKAIWVENKRADVKVKHYKLTKDLKFDENIYPNPQVNTLEYKRVGDYVPATAEKQDENWILATHDELMAEPPKGLPEDLKKEYIKYNNRVKMNNTFFQTFRVADNINVGTPDKPDYKPNDDNEFIFFYRPFRTRNYKVNYLDERGKKDIEEFYNGLDFKKTAGLTGEELIKVQEANKKKFKDGKAKLNAILDKYKIVDQEKVVSQCRHFDARNYRPIPGWKLVSAPQQQLFYDVNEDTNEFLGINGTSGDQIFFYYKDARVIEVPKDGKTPEGYVRVTFKADKGGSFGKDKDDKDITELHYDVIKGLKSDLLQVPGNPVEESGKEKGKYYITPDDGKSFKGWSDAPLLNKDTIINEPYTFTAKFDWSGLTATGLVRTEAFTDPKGTWTNDFAPKIEDLKKQLVWKENDQVKPLPAGAVKLFDEAGNELTTDDQVYNLVTEKKAADKDELVRTVNVKAKVTFKDGKEPQELIIPITVYKNVYEALNKDGDKPLFLSQAEGKKAEDGGLSDVTGKYVKVTIAPTGDMNSKDNKVYYVNPKAWVEIPEVKPDGSSTFVNWTSDIAGQNEEGKKDGIFGFGKRHKFTENTVISPSDAKNVVEQTDPKKKPNVPKTYVKVIVKTTDKATDETKFEKTFWVNPTKEVAITVAEPTGKENQEIELKDGNGKSLGKKKVNYNFNKWQIVKTGENDTSLKDLEKPTDVKLDKQKYTAKVTVVEAVYKNEIQAEKIDEPLKTTKLDTPKGKEITKDDLIKQITPQEGKEIESIEVISKPDGNTVGNEPAKVIVKYKDGTTQGSTDNPVVIPVEVHKNIIPAGSNGEKPKEALENYKKVIFKVYTNENEADYKVEGGSLSGNLIYYVSPEVEVNLTETAKNITKTPFTGYIVNGENWINEDNKILQGKFTDEVTEFAFKFGKSLDIVEKTNENPDKPDGYVQVTFKTEDENKGMLSGDVAEKVYYVNPTANITLKDLKDNEQAEKTQLAVPKTIAKQNYEFDKWQEAIDETTPIKSERVHVAIFKSGQVTLTYNKGGDDVTGEVPATVTVNYGTTVGLAGKGKLAKPNATFAGWKLDEDETIYQPGDQVKLEKARTATAQWTTDKHKVKFDTKGGSEAPATQEIEHNGHATKPADPTQTGKVFMGWKENESDTTYFDFAKTAITENKTLIAIWQDSVQKINDGDTVEEQFIKVTFNEGKHGKLKLDKAEQTSSVTYKVAKNLSIDQAVKAGLKVPEIVPAKYYKAKAKNKGWDKELNLTLEEGKTEKIFTAQYEPQADVIPVDPKVTDEEQIKKEKPEEMVLVTFVVPEEKAYMDTAYKFYVAKNKEVKIKPPVVYNKVDDYEFKEWQEKTLQEGMLVESYKDDTTIPANGVDIPDMEIQLPNAGDTIVTVIKNTEGATGKLVVIVNGQEKVIESKEVTKKKRKGRRFVTEKTVYFELPQAVQSGDSIKYWAEKDGIKSSVYSYMVK